MTDNIDKMIECLHRNGFLADSPPDASEALRESLRARRDPAPVEVSRPIGDGQFEVPTEVWLSPASSTGEWNGAHVRTGPGPHGFIDPHSPTVMAHRYVLASLASTPVGEVPAGWKLVPVEPTEAMHKAALDQRASRFNGILMIYKAMLAASPAPAATPQETYVADNRPETRRVPAHAASKGVEAVAQYFVDEEGEQDHFEVIGPGLTDGALLYLAAPSEPEAQKAVAREQCAECSTPTHCKSFGYENCAYSKCEQSPAESMEVQGRDEAWTRVMNAALTYRNHDPEAMDEQDAWVALVDAIGALAAKNGWRLGEGQ